jgi:hypothetical protein
MVGRPPRHRPEASPAADNSSRRPGMVKSLFGEALRASFDDLAIADHGSTDYLASLLTRFAATVDLYPLAVTGARLESLADRLAEIQRSWRLDGRHFEPSRELEIRQGIGDFTLFMCGFFWERVKGHSVSRLYVREGKRAYRFLAEYHRAQARPEAHTFQALAGRFETYAAVLSYMRDVHLGAEFAPWPHKVFARIVEH